MVVLLYDFRFAGCFFLGAGAPGAMSPGSFGVGSSSSSAGSRDKSSSVSRGLVRARSRRVASAVKKIINIINLGLDEVKMRLTVDLFKIFSEMTHVFLLDVRKRLAEISTFWPGAIAESMSVGVQLLNSRVYQTLRQQFPHCSKDVDPP